MNRIRTRYRRGSLAVIAAGDAVALHATVAGNETATDATGTDTFAGGPITLGVVTLDDQAPVTPPGLRPSAGSHGIVATYNGDNPWPKAPPP